MIEIDKLMQIIKENSFDLNEEFKRVFHGRDNYYEGWSFLTIDSIDTILSITFYKSFNQEDQFFSKLKDFIKTTRHKTVILQRRYEKDTPVEVLQGELPDEVYAIENGIKFKLDLLNNQNSGYFPDMKNGREFIKSIAKGKNVLNLFSYTCAFSLFAAKAQAKELTNVDMSKGALTKGRQNHHINNIPTTNINFMPYNILKSFSRIKKNAPYDIIIIDPPTFQKGSFAASKDYVKIIRRLEILSSDECVVLACLNSPDLDESFLIELFKENAPQFSFQRRLKNLDEFPALDDQRSLKNLIFTKSFRKK